MTHTTRSSVSAVLHGDFDPEAVRVLVEGAKQKGLIRGGATGKVKIAKDGKPAAALAAAVPASEAQPTPPAEGVVSQWMDVDPGLAAHWLQNNFRNRPLSEDVVSAYARDMINGVWMPTHQGIAFNDRDELIDGQHRLRAVIKSGKTVRMMVTFNLPAAIEGAEMTTMDAVDRGRTRSVADQLKIQHGMKHGSVIAACCQTLGGLCFQERTRRLSVGQTLDIYRAFQPAVDFVIAGRSKSPGLRMTGVLAGFAFALAALDGPQMKAVMQAYGDLVAGNNAPDSAIGQLHAFLCSDDAKLLNRGTDRGLSELVLQAIWLRLHGSGREHLEPVPDGAEKFRAMQPERVAKIAGIFRLP